jgi:hypothetical protein
MERLLTDQRRRVRNAMTRDPSATSHLIMIQRPDRAWRTARREVTQVRERPRFRGWALAGLGALAGLVVLWAIAVWIAR